MATIRRSGGFVAFYWQGKLLDPREEPFCEALAEQRFRTIENAASEEESVGWVTPTLPTGDDFTPEDLDGGAATWLRIRIDKKVLPKKWLQIHLETEERARGKKLPPRERRELKEELGERLLPRVLPNVNLVDALMFHDRKTLLLFATGKSVVEAFGKLFFETFSIPLDRANPYQCALHAGLDPEVVAALDRAEPVRWPDNTKDSEHLPPMPLPRSVTAAKDARAEAEAKAEAAKAAAKAAAAAAEAAATETEATAAAPIEIENEAEIEAPPEAPVTETATAGDAPWNTEGEA